MAFTCYDLKLQTIIHAYSPPLNITHLPCFMILLLNPILATNIVDENSTTKI